MNFKFGFVSCLTIVAAALFVYVWGICFVSLVPIAVLFGNPKQISDWTASEWSLYSPTVL